MGCSISSASLLMMLNRKVSLTRHTAIQRPLNRLEKWADRNFLTVNKGITQGHPAGKQLYRREPECLCVHESKNETAMGLCCKED